MIRINKNNLVYHSFRRDVRPEIVSDIDLMEYLSDEVKIGKGVTFERIFNLMLMHSAIINLIYARKSLGYYTLEMYEEEFVKPDDDDSPSDIDYLEVYWHSEYWNFDGDKELSCYPSFHGICENYTDENMSPETGRMNIGLDFVPINRLKKYVVKIDDMVKYHDHIDSGTTIEERYPLLVEGKTNFKLFDLFEAILHEISFYGLPKDRNKEKDKLDATIDRIKDGTEKLYEMKKEDGKYNFYDIETGELHDSLGGDDSKNCGGSCSCSGSCDCIDD